MTGALPAGVITGIGSVPLQEPATAVAASLRDFPDCPHWPQIPQASDGEGMAAQILTLIPGVVGDPAGWVAPWLPGAPPRVTLPLGLALDAERASGYGPFLDALKTSPLAIAKTQLAGPLTLAWQLRLVDETPALEDPATVRMLAELVGQVAARMVQDYRSRGVRTVLCSLDEPGWLAVSLQPSWKAGYLREELVNTIARVQATGALAMLHCCADVDFSQFAGLGLDVLAFDAAHYLPSFLDQVRALRKDLETGLTVGWGIIDTWPPVQPLEVLGGVDYWRSAVDRILPGGWEAMVRQSLFTPACGMGFLSLEEAAQVTSDLRAFAKAVRQVQLC